ncbi:hypothetical protein Pmani_014993 [Petrolisthes manimaculis]|uniref:Cyclin-like domain-containing protein n=1 Tax=Petrolisthes manimaculis TaxID=1843537 RepID=A0AAE1PSV1_9EUCA|nr:hypothetical protein Pmani_014993 [Petrolisthes manimaculis]
MAQYTAYVTDYADEVLLWMRHREAQQLPYNGNSPQLSTRGQLVEFLCFVTEQLKLSVVTTHLAVYLMDRFMDGHHINDSQLKLTALTAILVAAKFEEKDMNVPRIPDLNIFAKNKYGITIFNAMEIFMLKFFNWNVGTVTVAHFAELYLSVGLSVGDTISGNTITNTHLTRISLWNYTARFLDISLHDQGFLQWGNSLVAAGCVACGRLLCHFNPVWSNTLHRFTGYDLQALSEVMNLLIR